MKTDTKSLKMSILASPDMENFRGVVHGGKLLHILDQVAYACATRYCGAGVVTFGVDQVSFRRPIPIGSLMHFYASINYTGNTSCEVGIRVEYEDIKTQQCTHCNSSYFTMIALNDKGEKVSIPPFIPQTEEEKHRFQRAQERRKNRFA